MSGALQAVFQNQRSFVAVPGAPTVGTATQTGMTTATVGFTQPASNGGLAITQYRAISTPGSITGTLNQAGSGTITISGLTQSTNYTFTVRATNAIGNSAESSASNQVTTAAPPVGQQAFTTAGSFSWVAPADVSSVAIVAVGRGGTGGGTALANCCNGYGGGGGGGGGLGYKNNRAVTPGNSYTVVVGGTDSYFCSPSVVKGGGGGNGSVSTCAPNTASSGIAGTYTGDGGGNGGLGGVNGSTQGGAPANNGGAGAGAAGYAGNGGNGGRAARGGGITAGAGGGGGGGGTNNNRGSGGGGVGILGQGGNGAAGTNYIFPETCASQPVPATGGGGGSGGVSGQGALCCSTNAFGGVYGGGGGGSNWNIYSGGPGGVGAVRIIWGPSRSFPSTGTGNQ